MIIRITYGDSYTYILVFTVLKYSSVVQDGVVIFLMAGLCSVVTANGSPHASFLSYLSLIGWIKILIYFCDLCAISREEELLPNMHLAFLIVFSSPMRFDPIASKSPVWKIPSIII